MLFAPTTSGLKLLENGLLIKNQQSENFEQNA